MKKCLLIVVCSILLISCEKDNSVKSETMEFIYGQDFKFVDSDDLYQKGLPTIQIISIDMEIGRVSRKCRGIGICSITICIPACATGGSGVSASVLSDTYNPNNSINYGYVLLPIESTPPSPGDLNFYVESDIIQSVNGQVFTFHQGVYQYDGSIGDFGGYTIPVTIE